MRIQPVIVAWLLATALPSSATAAEREDPAEACYRSASSGSVEPFDCDLAVQVAMRNSDSRASAAAYTNRGLVLARAGRLELALKDQEQAVTLLPGHPAPLLNRAGVLLQMGRTEDALRDYDRAAAAAPESPVVYFNRAFANLALGAFNAAEADVRRARSLIGGALRRSDGRSDSSAPSGGRGR